MKRRIIKINEEKCNGCGACAAACHEGAIGMVSGKAKLLRDDYCDGLGDCLPSCPTGAITFEERDAAAFDEKAVILNKLEKAGIPCGCPGIQAKTIILDEKPVRQDCLSEDKAISCEDCGCEDRTDETLPCGCPGAESKALQKEESREEQGEIKSELRQWPVQIKLVPINAPYLANANLLIAADCAPFAYADFHRKFMKNKITLVGCPKLDMVDYSEKLTEIIKNNTIKSVTVVRMQVACCGGLENAVKKALMASGKFLPWQIVTITADGKILD